MGFKKFNGKNAILSMILCSVTSFSLLHADSLKECESEEDKQAGCVVVTYDGNLKIETPFKNGKIEGIQKAYYESGDLFTEIQYTNNEVNGMIKVYYEGKSLSGRQTRKMEN